MKNKKTADWKSIFDLKDIFIIFLLFLAYFLGKKHCVGENCTITLREFFYATFINAFFTYLILLIIIAIVYFVVKLIIKRKYFGITKGKLLIALAIATINILVEHYSLHYCFEQAGDVVFYGCPGYLGWITLILTLILSISYAFNIILFTFILRIYTVEVVDWVTSFVISLVIVIVVPKLINKFRKKKRK